MTDLELLDLAIYAKKGLAGRKRGLSRFNLEFVTAPNTLVIAGSNDLRDWLRNINTRLVPFELSCKKGVQSLGMVHEGFLEAAYLLYRDAVRAARDDETIHIAGHSLGGAVASLLAVLLWQEGYLPKLTTWGAPRVGNETFATSFPLSARRYVCGRDPVPRLPWWGYASLGDETTLASPNGRLSWLRDHKLGSYKRALEIQRDFSSPTE